LLPRTIIIIPPGAVGFFGGFGASKMREIRISTNIRVKKISGLNVQIFKEKHKYLIILNVQKFEEKLKYCTFNPLIFSPQRRFISFFKAHSRRFMSRTALRRNVYSFKSIEDKLAC
jgi:hypothetical protein